MKMKRVAIASLAVLTLIVGTSAVRAGDLFKLTGNDSAPTLTLELKPGQDGDVQETTFWNRGYYGGYGSFYRPSFYGGGWGGYNSYYGGGWGGYNSFYNRPNVNWGYNSYYVRPSYYSPSYYPSYYYRPSYYYSPYYCPISLRITTGASLYSPATPADSVLPTFPPLPKVMEPLPGQGSLPPLGPVLPNQPSVDGTYPYDGGPSNPVPLPKGDPNPPAVPNKSFAPGEGRLVSLPILKPTPKYTYPAYGDDKQPTKK
jgi:hypothetical protein